MDLKHASVDDWEALYVDGVRFDQGHSLNWPDVLERLRLLSKSIYFEPTEEQTDTLYWFPETWDEVIERTKEVENY